MQCLHPILGGLPCGRCIACRVNQAREWTLRLLKEAKKYRENVFITLTYDDDHIPPDYSLRKRDVQLWMKRVRKKIGDGVRFYIAGEYGSQTQRPHYHVVLFGVGMDSPLFDGLDYARDRRGHMASWPYGHVCVAQALEPQMRYISKYVTKKITGDRSIAWYHGRQPEFALMSRRPGIGMNWFGDHIDELLTQGGVRKGRKILPLPKAVKRKYLSDQRYDFELKRVSDRYPRLVAYEAYINMLSSINKAARNLGLNEFQAKYDDFYRFENFQLRYDILKSVNDQNAQEVKNFMANLQRKEKL